MWCLTASKPAFALDKIYSPIVHKGEWSLEYSGSTTFDHDHAKDNIQEHEAELEYGLTNRLMLQLNSTFSKEPDEHFRSNALGIGGVFQFFEQGEYWLDAGALFSYGQSTRHANADSIEAKLLLEKQVGKFLNRANIGIEQEVGSHATGGPNRILLWSSRYLYNSHFEPGFELQSDFGKAENSPGFDKQEHYIGPAAYGKILPHLKYEAAYYFGISDAASRKGARLLLEYELPF